MAVDITALYCCLDDFCKVFEDWQAHRLIPSKQTRQRTGKLSRSEMLFIMVLFHLPAFKRFKAFYLYGIGHQHRACFGNLPHYDRFVSLMPRYNNYLRGCLGHLPVGGPIRRRFQTPLPLYSLPALSAGGHVHPPANILPFDELTCPIKPRWLVLCSRSHPGCDPGIP